MQERIFNSMKKSNMMHRIPTFLLSGLAFATLLYLSSCGEDNQPAVNSAPTFEEETYAFEVAENAATGDEVGTVSATDENSDELTYSITGSQTDFAVDASTGSVTITAELDFETTASYSLELEASDGTDTAAADVTITITDVNDNTPAFADASYSFEIAEDAAGSDEVGRVSATDADGTAMLTYSLSGEGAANFAISNTPVASGEEVPITVEANLASLTSPVTLTVTVDDGDNMATSDVEIVITAGANMPPVFASTPYAFSVASEATDGAVVGTITATDAENDGLTYSLSGNGATNFATNSTAASGEAVPITVASGANLASLGSSVTILLTVSDGSNTVTVNVLITIIAGNVAPLFDQTTYPFEIASSAAEGALLVGKVAATDSNTGDLLTYTLSGNDAAHFNIKDGTAVASGEEVSVVVAANANLPSLTSPVTITITAADDATPALTATAELEITINAGNVAPVFDPTTYSFELAESAASGTVVGTVAATDSNAGDLLTYTLSGAGAANFTLTNGTDVASGMEVPIATVAGATFDHETVAFYTFQVQVNDNATPALTAMAEVTVSITDVAGAPVLTISGTQTLTLNEGTTAGIMATGYTVSATDEDNDEVTFSVDDDRFGMADDGALNVLAAKVFDHETEPTLMLTITATDDSPGTLTDTETVDIAITDVAEPPVLTVSGTQTPLNEGTTAGIMATGFMVTATDEDNDGVTFSVDDDRFGIADDGALNVLAAKVFDHETEPTLMLTITATDDSPGTLTDTETVNIAITDVAEPPVLTVSGTQTLALNEGTTAGIMATGYTVSATDEDGDEVTFSVDDDRFTITDDGTLNVVANAVFDFETEPTITLMVTATDGTLTDTEKVNIAITDVATAPVITVTGTQTLTLDEGTTASLMATGFMVTATDEDNDGVTFSVNDDRFGLADDGTLNVLADKEFDYEDAANPSGEITLTVTATDDNTGMLTDTEDVTITVTNVTFSTLLTTEAIGNFSAPAFGDVDGDGDLDLLVGENITALNFYRWGEADGTGSGWTDQTSSLAGTPALASLAPLTAGTNTAPAFGDVDGDGDVDLLVGDNLGMLGFHRWGTDNDTPASPGSGWTTQTAPVPLDGQVIPGSNPFAAPAFGDVDGDDDMDLLVGADDGKLYFFRWGGADDNTAATPATGWTTVTGDGNNPFHAPDASSPFDVGGGAAPAFGDVDGDGDLDLVVGSSDGDLHFFRRGTATDGTSADSGKSWTAVTDADNPFDAPDASSPFDVGGFSVPAFGDVDNDDDLDLVVGEQDGNLTIWYRLSDGTWSQTSDAI